MSRIAKMWNAIVRSIELHPSAVLILVGVLVLVFVVAVVAFGVK